MQRHTHWIFAFLLFLVFNVFLRLELYMGVFAFVGAMIPDLDLKIKGHHRKALHNIWVLIFILAALRGFGVQEFGVHAAFSIGFLSHLISDAITHMGIMPLWPIRWPRTKGFITTGGLGEWVLMVLMLFSIFLVGGLL